MANSLEGLGTAELFPLDIDWETEPVLNLGLRRHKKMYPGTIPYLYSITDDVPETLKVTITVDNKDDEYTMLDFINSKRGKVHRFWFRSPFEEFSLKETSAGGTTSIYVYRNDANAQYQGFERVYIQMADGDILTRHIQSITNDDINDRYGINVAVPLDRDLEIGNHYIIGRLLLAAFKSDSITMEMITDMNHKFEIEIVEKTKEYDLV